MSPVSTMFYYGNSDYFVDSLELGCECSLCKHVFVFSWDQRGLLFLGIPNLLVGDDYHVKNEGCLLEVCYYEVV